jgi:hypothetical protein
MVDLVSTDAGRGYHRLFTFAKLVGTGPKRQVRRAWVTAPLEISVANLGH